MILIILESIYGFRSKSKIRSKNKTKIKEKGKILSSKKNGPLSWELLSTDESLEALLENEKQDLNKNYKINISSDSPNKINKYPFISNHITNNLNLNLKKENYSENIKSKTFRTVGPLEDSTVNNEGEKYSRFFSNKPKRNLKPGFYGSSRLTRF